MYTVQIPLNHWNAVRLSLEHNYYCQGRDWRYSADNGLVTLTFLASDPYSMFKHHWAQILDKSAKN